jgi:hypothetical protein
VSPVRYKLGLYIPEDGILHSDCHETLKSYKLHCSFQSLPVQINEPVIYMKVTDAAHKILSVDLEVGRQRREAPNL